MSALKVFIYFNMLFVVSLLSFVIAICELFFFKILSNSLIVVNNLLRNGGICHNRCDV